MGEFLRRIYPMETTSADTTRTQSDSQTVATSTRLVVGQDNTRVTAEPIPTKDLIFYKVDS